jgi:hypothetical protein
LTLPVFNALEIRASGKKVITRVIKAYIIFDSNDDKANLHYPVFIA